VSEESIPFQPDLEPVYEDVPFEPELPLRPTAGLVEFGRTSTRRDGKPAIHRVVTDEARGPYWYALEPLSRRRQHDLQNPEKARARYAEYNKSEKGRARHTRYNKSGRGSARYTRFDESAKGAARDERVRERAREASNDKYLNRLFVAIDSEGRCPAHMLDAQGRTPLEAYRQDGTKSRYLKKDGSGNYFEPHELSLVGAAAIERPYGTSIADAKPLTPHWLEAPRDRGLKTEECFDFLLSLPELYGNAIFVMFSAMYDWTMWLKDIPFSRAYEIVRQRAFKPPCKRMQGYVFWKQYAIQMQPHRRFDLGELRWPDDPYGEKPEHKNSPEYQRGAQPRRLQFKRKIRIYDIFRFSPKSFVETIRPLMKRGLISSEDFETIRENKGKRASFHLEDAASVKHYTSLELYSTAKFMHMMRDAYWTSMQIRLKSFHSPASAAGALLKNIGIGARKDKKTGEIIQGHSWPVKSVNLEYEQIIAHRAYYGGRFEVMVKGTYNYPAWQYDLSSAYPYAMQFLPSMRGGRWEQETPDTALKSQRDTLLKRIERCSILSIFKVRFEFYKPAPFYPLPYRLENGCILYPQTGYGYYMRDDVLAAIAWCHKFGVSPQKALIVEVANWFHPSEEAEKDLREGRGPFAPVAEAFKMRLEFDKKDPNGPEQLAIKLAINSCYGKLAERIYRGMEDGVPIVPPHASPWYASAITAHTRREIMEAALKSPEDVLQIATDAVYSRVPLDLPRLKMEADIKDGKADKLLGDWVGTSIPRAIYVQSGLAFYLNDDGSIYDIKSRGLPLKNKTGEAKRKLVEEIWEQWRRPYDPGAAPGSPAERGVSVPMHIFMPVTSAIVSPDRYRLRGMWGDVTKMIKLDDPGSKREIPECEYDFMDELWRSSANTAPRENPTPDALAYAALPDWVENEVCEAGREKRACRQYYMLEQRGWKDLGPDDDLWTDDDDDLLLADNEIIEP